MNIDFRSMKDFNDYMYGRAMNIVEFNEGYDRTLIENYGQRLYSTSWSFSEYDARYDNIKNYKFGRMLNDYAIHVFRNDKVIIQDINEVERNIVTSLVDKPDFNLSEELMYNIKIKKGISIYRTNRYDSLNDEWEIETTKYISIDKNTLGVVEYNLETKLEDINFYDLHEVKIREFIKIEDLLNKYDIKYKECPRCKLLFPHDTHFQDSEIDCNIQICGSCSMHEEIECANCGRTHERIDMINDPDGDWLCDDCYSEMYFECNHCGEVFRTTEGYQEHDDRLYCDDCYNENFFECRCCNNTFSTDRQMYVEDEDSEYYDEYLCNDCYENNENTSGIMNYHSFSNWHKYRLGNEPEVYFGFELEVEQCESDIYPNDMAKKCIAIMKDKVICSHDGSLSCGFEIISHPMTFEYMMSIRNELEEMLNYLSKNGYRSHEPGTCGLHVHLSRQPLENKVDNILMIFENFMEELIVFSRRKQQQIDRWAQFLSTYNRFNGDVLTLKYVADNKQTGCRYMAVNLQNSKTVELRLFRGTLNIGTFFATMKLINNIVKYVLNHDDIEGLTWRKLVGNDAEIRDYNKYRKLTSTVKASNNIVKNGNKKTQKDMQDPDTIHEEDNIQDLTLRRIDNVIREQRSRIILPSGWRDAVAEMPMETITTTYNPGIANSEWSTTVYTGEIEMSPNNEYVQSRIEEAAREHVETLHETNNEQITEEMIEYIRETYLTDEEREEN